MLVLDTDHVSVMEWSEGSAQQNLLRRLSALPPDDIFTTIVTYEEQTRGWMAYAARARTTAQQIEAYRSWNVISTFIGIHKCWASVCALGRHSSTYGDCAFALARWI